MEPCERDTCRQLTSLFFFNPHGSPLPACLFSSVLSSLRACLFASFLALFVSSLLVFLLYCWGCFFVACLCVSCSRSSSLACLRSCCLLASFSVLVGSARVLFSVLRCRVLGASFTRFKSMCRLLFGLGAPGVRCGRLCIFRSKGAWGMFCQLLKHFQASWCAGTSGFFALLCLCLCLCFALPLPLL